MKNKIILNLDDKDSANKLQSMFKHKLDVYNSTTDHIKNIVQHYYFKNQSYILKINEFKKQIWFGSERNAHPID